MSPSNLWFVRTRPNHVSKQSLVGCVCKLIAISVCILQISFSPITTTGTPPVGLNEDRSQVFTKVVPTNFLIGNQPFARCSALFICYLYNETCAR